MDSVPYAFCEAVCAVLTDFGALVELTWDKSNCGNWKAAAVAADDERVTVYMRICYNDGIWSYVIYKSDQNEGSEITFQDLKAISRRRVQISNIDIVSCQSSHISTREEIREVLKYSFPFVNLARMFIARDLKIPDDILAQLLSPFYNSLFYDIIALSYSKATEGFLRTQLHSVGLKLIETADEGWSDELRVAIQRFALTKPFVDVDVEDENSFVFGSTFLKKLFGKSCRCGPFVFTARFDVDLEKLRMFNNEMQIQSGDKWIVWRRKDGVEVEISWLREGRFYINFRRDN